MQISEGCARGIGLHFLLREFFTAVATSEEPVGLLCKPLQFYKRLLKVAYANSFQDTWGGEGGEGKRLRSYSKSTLCIGLERVSISKVGALFASWNEAFLLGFKNFNTSVQEILGSYPGAPSTKQGSDLPCCLVCSLKPPIGNCKIREDGSGFPGLIQQG